MFVQGVNGDRLEIMAYFVLVLINLIISVLLVVVGREVFAVGGGGMSIKC